MRAGGGVVFFCGFGSAEFGGLVDETEDFVVAGDPVFERAGELDDAKGILKNRD